MFFNINWGGGKIFIGKIAKFFSEIFLEIFEINKLDSKILKILENIKFGLTN